jgi:DNA-directed RNA polymerase specialized sigma24 family protein
MTTGIVDLRAVADESPSWFEDDWDSGRNPDLWIYRQRTVALLNRYFRMSMEMGKLPSILGQQFFRSHVTSYRASSFEDVVIFVHDVERSIAKLDFLSQELIARVIFQGFNHDETASLLGCCRKTVERRLPDAIDKMSDIFLHVGVLKPPAPPRKKKIAARQEAKIDETTVIM